VSSVLVVAIDHVGSSMAGPGIRYLWFSRELARRGHDVTLAVPFETDIAEEGFAIVVANPWHGREMTALCRGHDAVVAQWLPVPTMLALAGTRTRVIHDFYSSPTIEYAASARTGETRHAEEVELQHLALRVALETGNAFLCASERQRDLWLGALAGAGRIDPDTYRADPTFRGLVAVVPFGIEPTPPVAGKPVLKGVVPGIEPGDRVALWGGGIWDWLDPLTVIRAVERLGRPDLKLYFLGTQRPVPPPIPDMAMPARAIALAEELGLAGRTVLFNSGWVPYEDRGAYLLEADVGVSAHFDELETRFAFRTRLLDCIWAGLPIVTTTGDSFADAVSDRLLGRVVGYEDVDGYAAALAAVLVLDRESFAERFANARRELEWPRVVEPLAAIVDAPAGSPRPHRGENLAQGVRYARLRGQLVLRSRGLAGLARRVMSGAVPLERRDPTARAEGADEPGGQSPDKPLR
jgi:glycosyltransferase involved in cell wall biosynthesis